MTATSCRHSFHGVKALSIRHVDPRLARALERERRRRGGSLNQTVLDVLREALGAAEGHKPGNGLRALAGTWSVEQHAEFVEAVKPFEQVDPELWA